MKDEATEIMSIWELTEAIKDPRDPSGKRYPLSNILRLMFSGFICGCNCTAAVIRWAKRLSKKHKEELGFPERFPSEGTLSNLFSAMDVDAMEKVLNKGNWIKMRESSSVMHIAIDGKTIRGSSCKDTPAVHLISAFAVSLKSTLKQHKQDPEDNEITSALKLLKNADLRGIVLSGDPIFAQKKYMQSDYRSRR